MSKNPLRKVLSAQLSRAVEILRGNLWAFILSYFDSNHNEYILQMDTLLLYFVPWFGPWLECVCLAINTVDLNTRLTAQKITKLFVQQRTCGIGNEYHLEDWTSKNAKTEKKIRVIKYYINPEPSVRSIDIDDFTDFSNQSNFSSNRIRLF